MRSASYRPGETLEQFRSRYLGPFAMELHIQPADWQRLKRSEVRRLADFLEAVWKARSPKLK